MKDVAYTRADDAVTAINLMQDTKSRFKTGRSWLVVAASAESSLHGSWLRFGRSFFIISAQPTRLAEPSACPFDHPPPRQNHKPTCLSRSEYDLKDETHLLPCPVQQLPAIGTIDPHPAELFPRPRLLPEDQPCAIPILH